MTTTNRTYPWVTGRLGLRHKPPAFAVHRSGRNCDPGTVAVLSSHVAGRRCVTLCWIVAFTLGHIGTALAQTRDEPPLERVHQSAEAGALLPFTMAPRVDSQAAFVRVLGGVDSARNSGLLESTAEARLFGPLAVRIGTAYTSKTNNLRPTVGLRVQALTQRDHGVDMSVGGFYRPEGFTQAEGEIEAVLAFGRNFGRLLVVANAIYGQDPDAAERDGELRLAGLYAFGPLLNAGLDSRFRFDMGSQPGTRRTAGGARYDFVVGPAFSYALGPIALLGQFGMSALGQQGLKLGAMALAGLAGSI